MHRKPAELLVPTDLTAAAGGSGATRWSRDDVFEDLEGVRYDDAQ
jgi:hypothetical protein